MEPTANLLLIRADASSSRGIGHVMRCLALGQAWRRRSGQVMLASVELPNGLRGRLKAEGFAEAQVTVEAGSINDARETARLARAWGAGWVVLDGYHFSDSYQAWIKEAGLRLLVLDDFGHASHTKADLLLNQNLHARDELYANRLPHTRLLLGTRYALLREEFLCCPDREREIAAKGEKVLVTLGGSDAENVTLNVVKALGWLRDRTLEVIVVVGAGNPHLSTLRHAIAADFKRTRLVANVTDMQALMRWADVAVSGGGSTSWELAFMGLPALTLVLADNQEELAAGLAQHGVSHNLGWHSRVTEQDLAAALGALLDDFTGRCAMSACGRRLVDGRGADRVATLMAEMRA
jgi:UDP-2,4-diacetamido-2,4,6-trideoxy-beta-L-altropyranose hydrolase